MDIKKRIEKEDEFAIGCLMHLYGYQTEDEKKVNQTAYRNSVGFSGSDASFLSSIAKFYMDRGSLSDKQLSFAKKLLPKYHRQLHERIEPLPLKKTFAEVKSEVPKTSMKARMEGKKIGISFFFPQGDQRFWNTLQAVKGLTGSMFDKPSKTWRIPPTMDSLRKLKELGFEFTKELQAKYAEIEESNRKIINLPVIPVPSLKIVPYPYQAQGIHFLQKKNGGLIGDEMGLGKTLQAIGFIGENPELRPVVIVCPASLKINWQRELSKWMKKPEKIRILEGKKGSSLKKEKAKIFIVNYDILSGWEKNLSEISPKVVIGDEIQYCKNTKAQRTKAFIKLSTGKTIIALSGTPITNKTVEFWTILHLLNPSIFPSEWEFKMRYCNAQNNGYGWTFNGGSNTKELHDKIDGVVMLRRLKKDVLKELPPKTKAVVTFPLSNAREYAKAEDDIIAWIENKEGKKKAEKAMNAEALARFEKLKQLAVEGKKEAVFEWMDNFLESGEKLVVFTTHTKTLDEIVSRYGRISVKLDGSTSQAKRQEAVDRFQNDPEVKLFVGNVKAAGVGITLTAASNVVFVEEPWTPGDVDQCADRVNRIGQEADSITEWHLIAENTIEEDICNIIDTKRKVLDAVLDGRDTENSSLLSELIGKIKERR
jgi:SWI/SNF-related matrix-associated actin-dependent regulator of chromatin subfamily A-like protein 1